MNRSAYLISEVTFSQSGWAIGVIDKLESSKLKASTSYASTRKRYLFGNLFGKTIFTYSPSVWAIHGQAPNDGTRYIMVVRPVVLSAPEVVLSRWNRRWSSVSGHFTDQLTDNDSTSEHPMVVLSPS